MRRVFLLASMLLIALNAESFAQPAISDIFPREEFAARRTRVMQQIGDGVAILQATTERPGEQPLRQSNQFYYLCGVVEPRAILVLDGKIKRSTLYLYGGAERRARMFGSSRGAQQHHQGCGRQDERCYGELQIHRPEDQRSVSAIC